MIKFMYPDEKKMNNYIIAMYITIMILLITLRVST